MSALIVTGLTACSSKQESSTAESQNTVSSAASDTSKSSDASAAESSEASSEESSEASSGENEMSVDDVKIIVKELLPTEYDLQKYFMCDIEHDTNAEPYILTNDKGTEAHYQPVTVPGLDTAQKMKDLFASVYTEDFITSFRYALFEGDTVLYTENDEGKLCVNVDGGGSDCNKWDGDTITNLTFDNEGITFEISGTTLDNESITGYMTITNTENGWLISSIFYY